MKKYNTRLPSVGGRKKESLQSNSLISQHLIFLEERETTLKLNLYIITLNEINENTF